MDGFADEEKIYIATSKQITFAKYSSIIRNKIETGTISSREFEEKQKQKQKFTKVLKRMHAAEHKVFNCFMQKIRTNKKNISHENLIDFLPSIDELSKTNSYSFFCSSTHNYFLIIYSLSFLLLSFILNNFLSLVLAFLASLSSTYFLQKVFFLEKPRKEELKLAISALERLLIEIQKRTKNNDINI